MLLNTMTDSDIEFLLVILNRPMIFGVSSVHLPQNEYTVRVDKCQGFSAARAQKEGEYANMSQNKPAKFEIFQEIQRRIMKYL